MEQLAHPLPRHCQGLATEGCRPIDPALAPAGPFQARSQVSPLFHGVQHRVEGAGAELVPVPPQFLDHPLAVQVALGRVMQDVQPDEASQKVLVFHTPLLSRQRCPFKSEIRYREPTLCGPVPHTRIPLAFRPRSAGVASTWETVMAGDADRDPRHHTQNVQRRLDEPIQHLRSDVTKVDEPQLKAMFETEEEVLGGLAKAFHDYEQKSEAAWTRSWRGALGH